MKEILHLENEKLIKMFVLAKENDPELFEECVRKNRELNESLEKLAKKYGPILSDLENDPTLSDLNDKLNECIRK